MKIISLVATLALLTMTLQPVIAGPDLHPSNVINIHTGKVIATIVVPQEAIDHSTAIVPLGSAFDGQGKEVEGYAIIHYQDGYVSTKVKVPRDPAASCYTFLARGAKWKVTEPYVVAADVPADAVARNLESWDVQVAFEVFGNRDTASVADGPDTIASDGKNEVMWGAISDPGVIAITIVWGVFSGPTWNRELVEWDVVFNNVDFVWGDATLDLQVMDFENIATHEFGHAAGMGDLYTSTCSAQTMYGYASIGEIIKRTLEVGDINGVKALYK